MEKLNYTIREIVNAVKETALKELAEEEFRRKVDAEKLRIIARRKFFFPWKITITRR